MPDRWVLASGNAGKLREINALLTSFDVELVSQSELGISSVEETGKTFVENSLLKARFAAKQSKLPALADDSGIQVFALNKRPGLYSARFAGPAATDQQNNKHLLSLLDGVPANKRLARFICVLVFIEHEYDETPIIAEGSWYGSIAEKPEHHGGFGYDPIFLPDGLTTTAAALSLEKKNSISHRAKALLQLKKRLLQRQKMLHDGNDLP